MFVELKNEKECKLYKKKFMAKAPVWSNNPAHPFFAKSTAAPVVEPQCLYNPHMEHIGKHIDGLRYEDKQQEKYQPPFPNTWEGKDYIAPGLYDKFLKSLQK